MIHKTTIPQKKYPDTSTKNTPQTRTQTLFLLVLGNRTKRGRKYMDVMLQGTTDQ